MALVYATEADLEAALGPDPVPARADGYLIAASNLVRTATRMAVYDATPAGLPEDDDVAEAFKAATIAQVLAWIDLRIDPTQGAGGVGSATVQSSIGSANVTRGSRTGQDEDRAASLTTLVPVAAAHLDALGFLSRQPQAR